MSLCGLLGTLVHGWQFSPSDGYSVSEAKANGGPPVGNVVLLSNLMGFFRGEMGKDGWDPSTVATGVIHDHPLKLILPVIKAQFSGTVSNDFIFFGVEFDLRRKPWPLGQLDVNSSDASSYFTNLQR